MDSESYSLITVQKIIEHFKDSKAIIIACNTATFASLKQLQQEYDVYILKNTKEKYNIEVEENINYFYDSYADSAGNIRIICNGVEINNVNLILKQKVNKANILNLFFEVLKEIFLGFN